MSSDDPIAAQRGTTHSQTPPDEALVLTLTLAVSASLKSRGLAEPSGSDETAVELVLTRATTLARQLWQLIDDPEDSALVDRVTSSVELLAANLAAVVAERPRLS